MYSKPPEVHQCGTCRFFAVHLAADFLGAQRSECRRFPPPATDCFPVVGVYDWCGEHQAAQAQAASPSADSQAPQSGSGAAAPA